MYASEIEIFITSPSPPLESFPVDQAGSTRWTDISYPRSKQAALRGGRGVNRVGGYFRQIERRDMSEPERECANMSILGSYGDRASHLIIFYASTTLISCHSRQRDARLGLKRGPR